MPEKEKICRAPGIIPVADTGAGLCPFHEQYRHRFLRQYYGTSFPSGIGVHLFLLLRISGFRKPSGQVCFPAADRGIYGSRLRFIVDPAGVVSIIPLIRIVPKNLGNLSE